jgi:hypothetical protein
MCFQSRDNDWEQQRPALMRTNNISECFVVEVAFYITTPSIRSLPLICDVREQETGTDSRKSRCVIAEAGIFQLSVQLCYFKSNSQTRLKIVATNESSKTSTETRNIIYPEVPDNLHK